MTSTRISNNQREILSAQGITGNQEYLKSTSGALNTTNTLNDIFPPTQNVTTQDIATSTVAGFQGQSFIIGIPTTNSAATFTISGIQTAAIQITGIWTGTLRLEASVDGGTTYSSKFSRLPGTVYAGASAITANCLLLAAVSNYNRLRVRASTAWTGTAVITVSESINEHVVDVLNPVRLLDSTTSTLMTIKPASTAALATDTAMVTTISPNTSLPTAADKTGSGSIAGTNQAVTATTNGCSIVSFNIAGTWSATLNIEGSLDGGSTWIAIDGDVDATDTIISTTTTNGLVTVNCASYGQVRLRANPYSSGTANVIWSANQGLSLVEVFNTNGNSLRVQDLASGLPGTTIPTNAQVQGNLAKTALPTAVTDGQLVNNMSDKFGRQVTVAQTTRDLVTDNTVTITASTAETTILTAVASTFLDLTAVTVSNTSASATRVDFRDDTGGTVRFSIYVPAGDIRGMVLNIPRPQTAVNKNWTAQSSASVTDLRIWMQAVQNK